MKKELELVPFIKEIEQRGDSFPGLVLEDIYMTLNGDKITTYVLNNDNGIACLNKSDWFFIR